MSDAFWKRLERRGKCWVWTGPRCKAGYGIVARRIDGVRVQGAQRVAWWLEKGEGPKGVLRQVCDTPGCVRPLHWRDETPPPGVIVTRKRLIRELAAQGLKPAEIANAAGVTRVTVWRHLKAA
jgi:hypothetical protein